MAPADGETSTSAIVCEFLEAAIHTTLKVRGLYPAEIFERRRLYNVAVSKSRHPGLNEYIRETVYSLKPWVEEGKLEKLAIIFIDGNDKPCQKLVFQVKVLKELENSLLEFDALEHMLRAFILKIQVSDSLLSQLPEGCRFELLAYSWSRPDSSANNTVWVDEDPSGERVQIKDPKIVPIKSINNCNISLQLYAEM